MRIGLILLGLLLGLLVDVRAQEVGSHPPEGVVTKRSFDQDRIDAYKADPDLDYDRDLRHQPSWWERFKEWLFNWIKGILGTRASNFVVNNLLYIGAFVMIVIAILVLRRHGLRNAFHGDPRSLSTVTAAEEDIRGMDLPAMLKEAERTGDLRRAIRLHYLIVLRRLVDEQVLRWSPEHTDRDYMAQISDPALRSRFAHMALVFQWVWYGHAEVDSERYEQIRRPFVEFEIAHTR